MDDDLDPKEEEEFDELDDDLVLGHKKPKGKISEDDESLDVLAEEEDGILPEDSYDDQDLW